MRSPGWRSAWTWSASIISPRRSVAATGPTGCRSDCTPHRVRPATDYTWSKREAESILARSGVPFVIIRPSVVVGDSRDGRYSGKRYGVYQLWHAAERLMGVQYPPVIYAVAPPKNRLHLLHQDAFQAGFLACYRHVPAGRFVHLVSREETLPTLRDLYHLWLGRCTARVRRPLLQRPGRGPHGRAGQAAAALAPVHRRQSPDRVPPLELRDPEHGRSREPRASDRPCDAADPWPSARNISSPPRHDSRNWPATPGPMANGQRSRDSSGVGRGRRRATEPWRSWPTSESAAHVSRVPITVALPLP